MPRLTQPSTIESSAVQFVASPMLDMMNAMYFTGHVTVSEGVEGWPLALRREMAKDLLIELDFAFNYPAGDPGILGTFCDNLFVHPEAWRDLDSLVPYLNGMPDGIGDLEKSPGIQGLVYQAMFRYQDEVDGTVYARMPYREAIEQRLRSLDDRDAGAILYLYDRPAELRERLLTLISRFYREHYAEEMPRRLPALDRSVARHRLEPSSDAEAVARRLTRRQKSCLEAGCAGPYERHVFTPSMDMGVYNSCAIVGNVHGLFYPLEPEFAGTTGDAAETRLARLYKALGDEQRLRILRMLRDREMYAQEVVDKTGLHQSVVSRHLSFMKAVGLVQARKQNNMKFYSLNPEAGDMLAGTITLFESAVRG
ncbi:MAG: winged helix-turn-helix transcriptional regulator [Chloroflexi bacterium]|nr:MAG: winged helix-turn-helix transcriptional regulator [Chloroflexota bacterium]